MENNNNSAETIITDELSAKEQNAWWENIDLHEYFELSASLSKLEWDEIQTLALNKL